MAVDAMTATENPADLAAYITAMGPLAGEPLAALLDRWAWLGDKDPDLLNRVGGSEALAVADAILGPATP
jgi:hypothetical protein